MIKPIIVYTGPVESLAVAQREVGEAYEVVGVEPTPASLEPALRGAVALLDASMKVPVGAALIAECLELRVVSTATTGANHIDAAALAAREIPLLTLKGQAEVLRELTPAAELSWLLVMTVARRLRPAIAHVETGGWDRTLFPGIMLKGRTIGLVGMGRIGGWMARYATAFGMRVIGFDPFAEVWPEGVERAGSLEELLPIADIVSLHVHLSDDTAGMMSAERIASMKAGAILVNTSRGELVDEQALVEALAEGRLSGAGVDVLGGEPDIEVNPLYRYMLDHPEVVVTPHIGGFAPEAVDITVGFAARRIRDVLEGA